MQALEARKGEAGPAPVSPLPVRTDSESIFALANQIDTRLILDRYGIEHDDRHTRCPGCGEPGALLCERGGVKCLHNRCSNAGPENFPGLRLNVDIVAERENVPPLRAAQLLCDWFGIQRPRPLVSHAQAAGRQAPLPLVPQASQTPFPTAALPEPLRAWVEAESIATQTPPDLAAVVALATVSACLAKKIEVEIRRGWREPLNTYWLIALGPGNRKSAVFRDAVEPLHRYEQVLSEQLRAPTQAALTRLEIKRRVLKRAMDTAAKTSAPEDAQVAAELAVELEAERIPVAPRLVVDDVTPERLAMMLAEQGGRLALLSAEGGLFELAGGRYSDGVPNLDVFLKAHPGDDLRVDRVARGPVHVRKPALTLGLAVQPEVIRDLASKPAFRGSGLLARFFYSLPQSLVGRRKVTPPPVPPNMAAQYGALCARLLGLPEQREDGELVPATVRLDDDARKLLEDFAQELEPRLGSGGDLAALSDWANKLVGGVARIAGLLHFAGLQRSWNHSGDFGDSGGALAAPADRATASFGDSGDFGETSGTIRAETIESAIAIARYLLDHAQAAFALIGADPDIENAQRLLAWIQRAHETRFSKRDAWQAMKGYFKKADQLDAPLLLLCEHGYLREEQPERSGLGPGRKPGSTFLVLHSSPQYPQYPQNSDPTRVGGP